MHRILLLSMLCSTFCGLEAVLKTIYAEELCYNRQNPFIHLKYENTGILTSLSSDVIDNCRIFLLPKPSWSVVLSIYKYHLNEDEHLIIEDSDGHKVSLIGSGYFPDERKSIVSDGSITIHYKKNSTFDPSNHVKFQFTYTQVHSGPCSNGEFQCQNGKCLTRNLVCDRHNHCGDGSDMKKCDLPRNHDEKLQVYATETITISKKVNPWMVTIIVSSVVLAIIIIVFAGFLIHGAVKKKKENSKTDLPTVAGTVPSNPAPTNDLQPRQSAFARIRRSLRSTPKPKVEHEQKTNEPNSESYQVPAMYPQIPSAPSLPGIENPDFQPDE